jgi:hypothetical protein
MKQNAHIHTTTRPARRAIVAAGLAALGLAALGLATAAHADTFNSGGNAFTIDFVTIGNAGNADDAAFDNTAPGFSSPYGGVIYEFRMGVTEVPKDWITKAGTPGGGTWTGNQPAANITWYQAAAFVNWLNTSAGHQAAYNLDLTTNVMTLWNSADAWQAGGENLYRHKDAYYFLPSEDEWYKAAYHKNDGVTANYWDYATGSNTIPTAVASGTAPGTAVYNSAAVSPAAVNNVGGLSAYGTMGQNGNVFEWQESASDGINNSGFENRVLRGGAWGDAEGTMRSSNRALPTPLISLTDVGFRVASVPEPSSAVLLLGSGMLLLARRRREGTAPTR